MVQAKAFLQREMQQRAFIQNISPRIPYISSKYTNLFIFQFVFRHRLYSIFYFSKDFQNFIN